MPHGLSTRRMELISINGWLSLQNAIEEEILGGGNERKGTRD